MRLDIALRPGLYRDGTRYQSKGRWYDANLVRWYGSALGPILGWSRKGTATLTGMARAAVSWRDNSANSWLGVGTHSKLYVCNRLGAAFDITPSGFTAGRADATASGGYGSGPYGSGTYGTPRSDTTTTIQDATQWTLDTWGEDLVGVSPDDRTILQWAAPTTGTAAAKVTNSPSCDALVVTAERFLFALAAGTDPRSIEWSDQEDNTDWTASSTNQAGSFTLQTGGRLMLGKRVRGGTLLLTNQDAFMANYIGGTLVYGFDKIGEGCGAISRQAAAVFGTGEAVWLSPDLGFWMWNGGFIVPLQCEVLDYIRRDINLVQMSKVVTTVNSANYEIEWRYPSSASTEIDRCVVWQYKDNHWNIGRAARTCGVDKGSNFANPVLIGTDSKLYDHEIGWSYDDASPSATSGPIELPPGDNIIWVNGLYPDDATVGDVSATFLARRNADDSDTTYGPYTLTSKTDLRFSGGQICLEVTGVNSTAWRWGTPKLEIQKGEGRG